MYKTASVSAILAAVFAYFLYCLSSQSPSHLSNLINVSSSEEMALQSVSRSVVKKVLAVETAEVSVL
jgi:hypothetical protein